jgi:hypothetical protein
LPDATLNPAEDSFTGTWSDNYSGGTQSGTVTAGAPVFTAITDYANHGAYVSANGGGSDAAHSCIGMPEVNN